MSSRPLTISRFVTFLIDFALSIRTAQQDAGLERVPEVTFWVLVIFSMQTIF
jgi:hypothetical protein